MNGPYLEFAIYLRFGHWPYLYMRLYTPPFFQRNLNTHIYKFYNLEYIFCIIVQKTVSTPSLSEFFIFTSKICSSENIDFFLLLLRKIEIKWFGIYVCLQLWCVPIWRTFSLFHSQCIRRRRGSREVRGSKKKITRKSYLVNLKTHWISKWG